MTASENGQLARIRRATLSAMHRSYYAVMQSPLGPLTLRWSEDALRGLYFENHLRVLERLRDWTHDEAALAPVVVQLDEYFRGERRTFDLPLAPEGTPFQLRVWQALRAIPYGETRSYGALARELGKAAARAVGAANGQNPISVIVPCHRVIGADGSLTGFGGGLPNKRWLLQRESKNFQVARGASDQRLWPMPGTSQ